MQSKPKTSEFQKTLENSLRSNLHLRAAAIKQYIRQKIQCNAVSASANGKPTFLIYQMGKVGSTNLARELKNQAPNINVFQVHRMHEPYIKNLYKDYRSNSESPYYFSNYVGRKIFKEIIAPKERGPIKIICAIREPISRNISHFFQDIERFTPRHPLPSSVPQMAAIFEDRFEHEYPENWFDQEFKPITGIDVLGQSFDKEAGFQVYRNGSLEALIYKVEVTKTERFIEEFKRFTSLEYPEAAKHNIGGEKKYGSIYRDFKGVAKFSRDFLLKQHSSRYAKTFYTEKELEALRQRYLDTEQ